MHKPEQNNYLQWEERIQWQKLAQTVNPFLQAQTIESFLLTQNEMNVALIYIRFTTEDNIFMVSDIFEWDDIQKLYRH